MHFSIRFSLATGHDSVDQNTTLSALSRKVLADFAGVQEVPIRIRIVSIVVIVLIAVVWLAGAVSGILSRTRECLAASGPQALLVFDGLRLAGVLRTGLGYIAGESLITFTFEWPVGFAYDVVRDSRGRFIVPLEPCGRIQVYKRRRKISDRVVR